MTLLYNQPVATVHVNGTGSVPFPIERGTRQGCPLSPLLFALTLEYLACTIRSQPSIRGFRSTPADTEEEKIFLYADDILLHISHPYTTIPALFKTIVEYGHHSGYKINWNKSTFYCPNNSQTDLFLPGELRVVQQGFKYLGIFVTPHPETCRKENLS